ncbi:hypothetical protein HDK64DRAFT_113420 [Phyllosticta capitalensis]
MELVVIYPSAIELFPFFTFFPFLLLRSSLLWAWVLLFTSIGLSCFPAAKAQAQHRVQGPGLLGWWVGWLVY